MTKLMPWCGNPIEISWSGWLMQVLVEFVKGDRWFFGWQQTPRVGSRHSVDIFSNILHFRD